MRSSPRRRITRRCRWVGCPPRARSTRTTLENGIETRNDITTARACITRVLPEGTARMRHVWSLASVIVLGASAAGAARAGAQGTGFEGTLTFQMQGEQGATMTMVSTTKGNKLRMAVGDPANPTHTGEVVMDGDAHTEMMIMP